MAQVTSGVRSFLSSPVVYSAFQNLMGARRGWVRFVEEFIRPTAGERILDVGCGPADLLTYLPPVEYWGFDISEAYIARAQEKFGQRGHFVCKMLNLEDLLLMPRFDVVVASGVLHHLDDDMAQGVVKLAYEALKPGGRLVTVDPCWADGQHPIARFLMSRDRGENIRTAEKYECLTASFFQDRRIVVRHKAWIPYTHCFMECVRN